ncbi:MAG: peptidylprolyl isomerase, partial [Bacteroidota bacterium]
MKLLTRLVTTGLLLGLAYGCEDGKSANFTDPVLARVHQKELRLSELDGMFPSDASREDSTLIVQAFVNRWSRETVLQWEAERNLPQNLDIDRLVRDYRASLVSNHYEEVLVSMRLDSTVNQDQLEAYYEANKNQYLLERPIVRCFLIRVPYPVQEEADLQRLWNNGKVSDTMALANYCERFAEVALLEPDSWYSLDDIAGQLPTGTLTTENVSAKREFSLQEGSFRYYFRLLEVKPRLEIAPLSYVKDQARNVILHNRKRKVLEEALLQRELPFGAYVFRRQRSRGEL